LGRVTITDILGEEVYAVQQNKVTKTKQEINLMNMAGGTYFVHMQSDQVNYVQKIIINR